MFYLKRPHVFLKRLGIFFGWQEQEEGGSTPATHYALSLKTLSLGDRSVCKICHFYGIFTKIILSLQSCIKKERWQNNH